MQKSLPADADGAVHITPAAKAAAAPPTVAINTLVFMLGFLFSGRPRHSAAAGCASRIVGFQGESRRRHVLPTGRSTLHSFAALGRSTRLFPRTPTVDASRLVDRRGTAARPKFVVRRRRIHGSQRAQSGAVSALLLRAAGWRSRHIHHEKDLRCRHQSMWAGPTGSGTRPGPGCGAPTNGRSRTACGTRTTTRAAPGRRSRW